MLINYSRGLGVDSSSPQISAILLDILQDTNTVSANLCNSPQKLHNNCAEQGQHLGWLSVRFGSFPFPVSPFYRFGIALVLFRFRLPFCRFSQRSVSEIMFCGSRAALSSPDRGVSRRVAACRDVSDRVRSDCHVILRYACCHAMTVVDILSATQS